MAFSLSAVIVRFLFIVCVTTTLQNAPTEANEDCDVFDTTCPIITTPATSTSEPTTVRSTTTGGTTPSTSTYGTTAGILTPTSGDSNGTDINVTSTPLMLRSNTPPTPINCCSECGDHCAKCFGPGEQECTECKNGYTMDLEETGPSNCLPCNMACLFACQDSHNMTLCQCVKNNNNAECRNCPVNTANAYGKCRKKTPLELLTIPGVIGISIAGILIIVVVVVLCCRFCRKIPPKPVKRDYRGRNSNLQMDTNQPFANPCTVDEGHNNMTFNNQQSVDDDVYGNVDNHGNVIMYDMPDTENQVRRPSRVAPPPPGPVDSQPEQDLDDVYQNTIIEESQASPPMPPPKPSPQRVGPASDFGGMHGNTGGATVTDKPWFNPKNVNTPKGLKLPPVPEKLRSPPSVLSKPQGFASHPVMNRDDLPTSSAFALPLRSPPGTPEPDELPTRAPPPPPTKFSSLGTDAAPPRVPPPVTQNNKSASLPPIPVLPPLSTIKNLKKKPATPKKIVRQIDDNDGIRETVEIGPPPVPSEPPPNDDFGVDYEVSMKPQQDYGIEYEVLQAAPPPHDYGISYEVVELPPAPPPKQPPAPPPKQQAQDWGDSYEPMEVATAEEQDYGGDYELLEAPQPQTTTKADIGQRKQMPLPSKPQAPPIKRKPSHGDVYEDPDKTDRKNWTHPSQESETSSTKQDFGGEYRNLNNPAANAGRSHRPTPPALPKKQPIIAEKQEGFYQQALQLSEEDTPVKLFQKDELDIYQNNPSVGGVSRYRNVPQKATDSSVITGSYIKMQKK